MQYLTAEDIIVIHWLAIGTFGGRPGLLDEGRLQSCVESPKQTMFGNELYPDWHLKPQFCSSCLSRTIHSWTPISGQGYWRCSNSCKEMGTILTLWMRMFTYSRCK